MNELVLISVTGEDKPGITAGIAELLGQHDVEILDIGQAVMQGENQLQIKVANLWVNRLIGDAQPGAQKVAYTAIPTYQASAPLRPSGLIGPVRLLADARGQRAK